MCHRRVDQKNIVPEKLSYMKPMSLRSWVVTAWCTVCFTGESNEFYQLFCMYFTLLQFKGLWEVEVRVDSLKEQVGGENISSVIFRQIRISFSNKSIHFCDRCAKIAVEN